MLDGHLRSKRADVTVDLYAFVAASRHRPPASFRLKREGVALAGAPRPATKWDDHCRTSEDGITPTRTNKEQLLFAQPRHQFYEVARFVAAVELMDQYPCPAILYGPVGAGQSKNIGSTRQHRAGAALDRRSADAFITEHAEQFAKPGMSLFFTRSSASGVMSRPVRPVPPVK
jgi:hypothetical protein